MFLLFSCMQTLSFPFLSCPFSGNCLFHSRQFLPGAGCPGRKPWAVRFKSQLGLGGSTPPSPGTTAVIGCWGWLCPCLRAQIMLLCIIVKTPWLFWGFPLPGSIRSPITSSAFPCTDTKTHESSRTDNGLLPSACILKFLRHLVTQFYYKCYP